MDTPKSLPFLEEPNRRGGKLHVFYDCLSLDPSNGAFPKPPRDDSLLKSIPFPWEYEENVDANCT